MSEPRGFRVVEESDPDDLPPGASTPPVSRTDAKVQAASVQMLTMALASLAQRFVIALASLFTLVTVASAFWLFWETPDPTPFQLIKLGGYSLFVLAINVIARRK